MQADNNQGRMEAPRLHPAKTHMTSMSSGGTGGDDAKPRQESGEVDLLPCKPPTLLIPSVPLLHRLFEWQKTRAFLYQLVSSWAVLFEYAASNDVF